MKKPEPYKPETRPAICANPRCKKRFKACRDWQRFHSERCRLETHNREIMEAVRRIRKERGTTIQTA